MTLHDWLNSAPLSVGLQWQLYEGCTCLSPTITSSRLKCHISALHCLALPCMTGLSPFLRLSLTRSSLFGWATPASFYPAPPSLVSSNQSSAQPRYLGARYPYRLLSRFRVVSAQPAKQIVDDRLDIPPIDLFADDGNSVHERP